MKKKIHFSFDDNMQRQLLSWNPFKAGSLLFLFFNQKVFQNHSSVTDEVKLA